MTNYWVLPEELGEYANSEYAYEACASASYVLWVLSGRKYRGLAEATEEYDPAMYNDFNYHNDRDYTLSSGVRPFIGPQVRSSQTEFRLRNYPIQSVKSVTDYDGTTIDPLDYTIANNAKIVFKTHHNRALTINYTYGAYPPVAGRMAARAFALELAKSWSGADDCALPERVTSVSREGVSYTILDNQTFLDDLKTGIYQVDLFLKVANPDKARTRAKVFSPELRRGEKRTNVIP